MKLAISFLSIKDDLKENIMKLNNTTTDYIHLDIMDGEFVDEKTNFGKNLFTNITKPLDVHLMVNNIKEAIDYYSTLKPAYMTFHLEATTNPLEIINYIKKTGSKVGISINPNTTAYALRPYLGLIDLVLVMSVEPGKGGQAFIETSPCKLNILKELREKSKHNYLIEVDGGINIQTIKKCEDADIVVLGNYITSGDYQTQINTLNLREEK